MPAQPQARAGQADIVIAGGGPVGLMLACELRLSGTDPVVLERLPGIDDPAAGMNTALRTWFSPRTPPQTRH
jgi:2-polyprenyl-6-methoxyphenol hydroxylase-like FAD-dependent oxidoreductase